MARWSAVALAWFGSGAVAFREESLSDSAALNLATDLPHVCCFDSEEHPFEVYDPTSSKAQSQVEKCLLTLFVDVAGKSGEEVKADCKSKMENDKRYYGLLAERAQKVLDGQSATAAKQEASDTKDLEKKKKAADDQHESAVKKADSELQSAQKDHEAKAAAFAKAQQALNEATARLEAAKQTKSEADKTEAMEAEKTAATTVFEQGKAARQAKLDEMKKAIDDLKAKESSHSTSTPKCADGDCCCSVNRVPTLVSSKTFLDWDRCNGATKYVRPVLSLGCNYMSDCNICRTAICGIGMCP